MAAEQLLSRIAKSFITHAPPGQILEVERDVETLAGPGLPPHALAESVRAATLLHTVPLRVVGTSAATSCLCTPEALLDADHLLVSITGAAPVVGRVSYTEETAAVSRGSELPEAVAAAVAERSAHPLEELRRAVFDRLSAHVAACYNAPGAGALPWAKAAEAVCVGSAKILLVTSAVLKNTSNFYSGSFGGRWELDVSAGRLTGSVSVCTHYFESGNTQLHDQRAFDSIDLGAAPAAGDDAGLARYAAAAVQAIARCEDELQGCLESLYEGLSSTVLKELRRFLPTTGTKFDWSGVARHRMVKTLQGSAASVPTAAR